ncbi:nuclear transport factor 2 family protein [Nonomuraea sp. NPDC050643]|uniref:nuclear transport factor 2 family protein n=1 Tax=Nonomuraea sp. NPDC050643 TaxID=3155660 RepID=UPI00340A9943
MNPGHEVARHHRVIERWLSGAADRAGFGAFADAHAPGFTLAGPDGTVLSRGDVLTLVEAAHGTAPGLTIAIEGVRVVAESGDLVIVAYEEWHRTGRTRQGRRATAVLSRAQDTWRWLHLHETWLP